VPQNIAKADGSVVTNTESTLFDWHEGIKKADGRYSRFGTEALYTSIAEDTIAWETVFSELGTQADEPLVLKFRNYRFERVLNLTDHGTLSFLGIRPSQLVVKKMESADAYRLTQTIGDISKKLDIDALIVPSGEHIGGVM
jgi:RES domain-containing protein